LSFTTAVQIEKAIIGKSKRERKREHKCIRKLVTCNNNEEGSTTAGSTLGIGIKVIGLGPTYI
jgi:hypothetical protein